MARGKADFRAQREQLGLTQQDVADALEINIKTVKSLEDPKQTRYRISKAAWRYLDRALDMQAQQVAFACYVVEKRIEELGREPAAVSITYYRDQATYDRFGREAGPFGQANATANAIACELERTGIKVKFRYPDDSAIPTPRSNY